MRVLFFTSPSQDYLADSLLHGLRSLLGDAVVDFPKNQFLYKDFFPSGYQPLYGRGFTLYGGLLPNAAVDRLWIREKLRDRYFDYVVISNIWTQVGYLFECLPFLRPNQVVIVDGADSPAVYPNHGHWLRQQNWWSLPKLSKGSLYFKREWTDQSQFSCTGWLAPSWLRKMLPASKRLRKIGFSIPLEKIFPIEPVKTKEFPRHIVDGDIQKMVSDAAEKYAFDCESDYYRDLQASRFGITTKRSGWDCMRHYEIAANQAVICFRDLDRKPSTCAPHGLTDQNSIIYRNWDDLSAQTQRMTTSQYADLQAKSREWIQQHTTIAEATRFLEAIAC